MPFATQINFLKTPDLQGDLKWNNSYLADYARTVASGNHQHSGRKFVSSEWLTYFMHLLVRSVR